MIQGAPAPRPGPAADLPRGAGGYALSPGKGATSAARWLQLTEPAS